MFCLKAHVVVRSRSRDDLGARWVFWREGVPVGGHGSSLGVGGGCRADFGLGSLRPRYFVGLGVRFGDWFWFRTKVGRAHLQAFL